MIKIKNKKTIPKPAKIARFALVGMLLFGIVLMLCSFSYPFTVNIDKSNASNYIYYIDVGGYVEIDDFIEVPPEAFTNNIFTINLIEPIPGKVYVNNGVFNILDDTGHYVDVFEFESGYTISNGYYEVVVVSRRFGNTEPYSNYVIDGYDPAAVAIDGDMTFRFYTTTDFNSNSVTFVSDPTDVPNSGLEYIYILTPYEEPSVTDNLTNVWYKLLNWIVNSITSVTRIFWTGEEFTLIGVMSIVPIGIGLILLMVNFVVRILKQRS